MSALLADRRLPWLALAACLAAFAALVLTLQAQLGFAFDEWDFLLGRRSLDADSFLAPHHEHIAISHVAIYTALADAFGIGSPLPFQVVSTLMLAGAAALVFAFLSRRVAWPVALAGVLPLLVLGPAAESVIWPFQLAFSGSIAAGMGALLALERGDRVGDLLACALLVVALSFSSLGIPFAVGVAVHVALSPRWRARLWIALVPIAAFGIWWLGWGRDAESFLSFKNVANSPGFIIDGLASSIASLVGLGSEGSAGASAVDLGRPLLLIALTAAALRLRGLGSVPPGVWVAAAIAISFWLLAALNANGLRLPTTGRYQLIGALFVLLVAAELLRGVRISRAGLAAVLAIAVLAVAGNLEILRQNWVAFRAQTEYQRGAVSAVEIARDRIEPDFVVAFPGGATLFGDAALYLNAVDELGSPAYDPGELAVASEPARGAADAVLAKALGLRARPVFDRTRRPGCVQLEPDELGTAVAELRPGVNLVSFGGSASGPVKLRVRRFAAEFSVDLGAVSARRAAAIEIPEDRAAQPWELQMTGIESAALCAGE